MLKNVLVAIFLALLVFVGAELKSIFEEKNSIAAQFAEMEKELERARAERGRLEADLLYISVPENLEKELRSRFHYQDPGEKVLILVPSSSSTATTSD
jgi:cell division protein FtsB